MIAATVIILNAITIAMVAGVIVLHFQAWRRAPRGLGILPLHVIFISMAQIIFIVLAADQILPPEGTPEWTWQFGVYLAGMACTIGALVAVGEFQRRRLIAIHKERIKRGAESDE